MSLSGQNSGKAAKKEKAQFQYKVKVSAFTVPGVGCE
jgi:hypothetical protein